MVGVVAKVTVGVGLFVGSLFGGLALTGRLNHEGTANIPVLSSFFPAALSATDSAITADQYHAKIEMMRLLAVELNAAGIWPIYSTFNGFAGTKYRD